MAALDGLNENYSVGITGLGARKMGMKEPHGHLAVKILFFLFYAGIGQFLAFLNVYYNNIGLSGMQIGLLGTISTAIAVIQRYLVGNVERPAGQTTLVICGRVYRHYPGNPGAFSRTAL